VAHVDFDDAPKPAITSPVVPTSAASTPENPAPREQPVHSRRGRPVIPAWEDVLLGVRSSGQR
jgi:hypothetical protein